jgi:hypothetical protein
MDYIPFWDSVSIVLKSDSFVFIPNHVSSLFTPMDSRFGPQFLCLFDPQPVLLTVAYCSLVERCWCDFIHWSKASSV